MASTTDHDTRSALMAIFAATRDAVLLIDPQQRVIVDANPAACNMFGYAHEQLVGMRAQDLIDPDSAELYESRAGQEHHFLPLIGRRADGSQIDIEISSRELSVDGRVVCFGFVHEITEETRAFELLEERVAERTRELNALLEVSRAVAGTLELQPLLGVALDRLAAIVEYTEALVMLVEGNELCIVDYRGPHSRDRLLAVRFPIPATPIFQVVLQRREPVIIDDTRADDRLARELRAIDPRGPAPRSIMCVPLTVKDRIIGQLRLEHATPNFYTAGHATLAMAIAHQAAVAIENARLFEETERRRREVEALYRAEEALHRSLQRHDVLQALVDAANDMLHADKASVLLWDDAHERIKVEAQRGFETQLVGTIAFPPDTGISHIVAETGEPITVYDLDSDPRLSERIKEFNRLERISSLISVPIEMGGRIFGVYNVHSIRPRVFTAEEARMLLALARRAASALENARLYEDERSTRERLEVAVAAGRMGAWEWDMRSNRVKWSTQLEAIHGLTPASFGGTFADYLADIYPEDRASVQEQIEQSLESGEHHLQYRIVWPDGSLHWLEASGRVVRDKRGRPVGMRGVCQDITDRKNQEEETARLHERERIASEARAALEERQRLARELHDSVSQALYGIALGTQTALAALREDRDVEAGANAAEYVLKLAQASIAEMRALIFELRPESLDQEGLLAALQRQVDSVRARHALHVQADLGAEPSLSLDTKEMLYRIAQEAMHNAVKHAHASALRLRLGERDGYVELEITDDGVGFDPTQSYPGHLGLTSMRERATAARADLSVTSCPGQGTTIRVRLPRSERPRNGLTS